ncbi:MULTISPECIES: HD family phosphohydrolase [unclassified Prevotella]|uniref:HD family phosphohydrolase n=1 Tax=unclassified Prevotella TaxID=2638335 RepID=UPI00048DB1F7|nr:MULTISPECIES: HDIG domain-containing metalloprotein [unclassified Prevotella]
MSSFNIKNDLTWRDFLIRLGLIFVTVVIIVWMMPHSSQNNFKIEKGRPWIYTDLKAPFDFPIYKSDEAVKLERDSMMKQYEPYYIMNPETVVRQLRQFSKDYSNGIPGLHNDYISIISNRLRRLYEQGIMSNSEYAKISKDTSKFVRIVNGKHATSIQISRVYSVVAAYEQIFQDQTLAKHRDILQKCNLNDYITPNLLYDKERSEASLNDILNSIPLASGLVQRGEKIIDRGDIVDEKTYNKLLSFQKEMERQNVDQEKTRLNIMGQILFTTIFITCFTIFLTLFRKDYFEKVRSTTMLYTEIVLFTIIASMMVKHSVLHVYIVPFAMVPIFIRVFMDSRTAFMAHTTMIMTCACFLQYPLEFVAVEMVSGLVAIFSLRELSSRSQLFWTAVSVTAAGILTNLALDWIHINDLSKISYSEYNYLIINGVLLFCSYPLLYVIEKAFGFTSNITLIELSDMNKELLRKMSEVAPGTFQHSIQVGNLAAEIANKIGAKSQLVRTGALYHDIGKISNPIYFTENQSGVNPHEKMSYIDSAQMIISHVTEGTKLADKYNLPNMIKEFITTHHGQGKTKYFYVQYKNEHPDEEVDDLLFTYPGPNPFTKEQAILMMADTVEAASRSLPDYTEKSIRDLVNRLIDAQVAEGYFKECPITFRDIAYAKTVLIEKLKTIYHTRVSYPELKK